MTDELTPMMALFRLLAPRGARLGYTYERRGEELFLIRPDGTEALRVFRGGREKITMDELEAEWAQFFPKRTPP